MEEPEFSRLIAVLYQYGLRQVQEVGGLFIIERQDGEALVFVGDPSGRVPVSMLTPILEAAGMEESTFWQLYETI